MPDERSRLLHRQRLMQHGLGLGRPNLAVSNRRCRPGPRRRRSRSSSTPGTLVRPSGGGSWLWRTLSPTTHRCTSQLPCLSPLSLVDTLLRTLDSVARRTLMSTWHV